MADCVLCGGLSARRGGDCDVGAILLDIRAVAALLNCSVRHVHRLRDAGRMPQPVKLGSLSRWRRGELEEWIAAGCPPCSAARKRT